MAREVHRADAEPPAELVGDLEPVDAGGGPAVYQQQHRSVGIAHLDVEHLDRRGTVIRRTPREMTTTTPPIFSSLTAHHPTPVDGPSAPILCQRGWPVKGRHVEAEV